MCLVIKELWLLVSVVTLITLHTTRLLIRALFLSLEVVCFQSCVYSSLNIGTKRSHHNPL